MLWLLGITILSREGDAFVGVPARAPALVARPLAEGCYTSLSSVRLHVCTILSFSLHASEILIVSGADVPVAPLICA